MGSFRLDFLHALRVLRNRPALTAAAVITLAIGIAATSTVYGWIDGALLHPYPGVDDRRMAVLEMVYGDGRTETPHLSLPDAIDFRDNLKLVSEIALHKQVPVSIGEGQDAQRIWCELVSGNYFAVLGVKPILGRVFSPDEYSDNPEALVAVISHRLWHSRFDGDPKIVGRTVRMNRRRVTIVGVAPPEFRGLVAGLSFDGWVPLLRGAELARDTRSFEATVRLQPGVTVPQANAEAAALASELARLHPDTNTGYGARVVPVWKAQSGAAGILFAPLRILGGACFLVLFIACANVANLLLAGSAARREEFSLRLALGAGPGRLARQLLTESLLLAGLSGILALLLILWTSNALTGLIPPTGMPVFLQFQLNPRVLAFTLLMSVAAGAGAGIPTLLSCLRTDLNEVLKQGGRGAGTRSHRTSGFLVIAEVSLALVALVGAGLFVRSFRNLSRVNPGFDANNILLARLPLSTSDYTPEQEVQFCRRLRDRLLLSPQVKSASYGDRIPLGFGTGPWSRYRVDGYVPARGESMVVDDNRVAPGYFELMRTPLVAGRDFRDSDTAGAPCVVIVTEAFGRRFLGGREAVGRRVIRESTDCTVIGVVKDHKLFTLHEPPRPYVYTAYAQSGYGSGDSGVSFYIRTEGDPSRVIPLLRREMAALDPKCAGFEAMPLTGYAGAASFATKLAGLLLAVLAGIALLLAAVGLYAVMAHSVNRRTQEIGIRVAVGAEPRNVLAMVVRNGMILTAAGLALGAGAALAATKLVAHMLFGVGAADPLSYAGAAAFLGAVALLACYIPARRATRVEPTAALRCQ